MLSTMKTLHLKMLSCVMCLIFPVSSFAADQPAAMLYTHGTTLLNGSSISRSSAIFSGDLVQTDASSAANINAAGSIVLVLNDSLVQYEDRSVELEHGGLTVSTSKQLVTRAGNVVVSPAASVWTEFSVRDVDGTVKIEARKGDLTIIDDKGAATTLAQGQETTREASPSRQDNQDAQQDDQKKKKKRPAGAMVPAAAAGGGVLNSPVAIGIGGAAILGLTTWVLVQSDDPASPAKP